MLRAAQVVRPGSDMAKCLRRAGTTTTSISSAQAAICAPIYFRVVLRLCATRKLTYVKATYQYRSLPTNA